MDREKKILDINLDDILPNRFQPRIRFDEEALNELAESIKEHGVIQPIIVRQIGDKYEIIAGERRYKASVIAGKSTIPAIVSNLDDGTSAEIALIENVQRQDLTPIEEAVSYKKILDMGYLTQEELALKIDRNQSTISNKLRLLNLSEKVQDALLDNQISERHARSLLRLDDFNKQEEMLDRIINERLTVRKTDTEIDKMVSSNFSNESISNDEYIEVKPQNTKTDVPEIFNINIPSAPIVNDDEIEEILIEDIPLENDIYFKPAYTENIDTSSNENLEVEDVEKSDFIENNFNFNPGFLNIDEIEKNAKDINIPKEKVDIDSLLKVDSNIEKEKTTNNEVNENLTSGKFFNFKVEPTDNQENIQEDKNIESKGNIGDNTNILTEDFNKNMTKEENINSIFDYSFLDEDIEESKNTSEKEATKERDEIMVENNYNKNQSDKVDFKVVINTIRECASKIEKEGFTIDLEEFDFEDYYQVVFKVNKKE